MFKCATAVTPVFGVLHAGSPFRAFPRQCVCFLDRKNLRHLTSARLTCMHKDIEVNCVSCAVVRKRRYDASTCLCYTVITCPIPDLPPMTEYNSTSLTYLSRVTYFCRHGYKLGVGNEVRICRENGKWDGNAPTCESKSPSLIYVCPMPECHTSSHFFLVQTSFYSSLPPADIRDVVLQCRLHAIQCRRTIYQ